jgi:hypothetical protein
MKARLIVSCAICLAAVSFPMRSYAQNPDVKLMYTGKLFGYYNQELLGGQKDCFHALPAGGAAQDCTSDTYRDQAALDHGNTKAVRDFLNDDDVKSTPQPFALNLLVGMGDNFAPEIESRLQRFLWSTDKRVFQESAGLAPRAGNEFLYPLKRLAARPGHSWQEPESLDLAARPVRAKSPDGTFESFVESAFAAQDNVANFLLLSGYTAIVPGRQDFLYGSVHLAKLAELLKTDSANSLHMLAANLRYQKVGGKPSTRNCPLLLGMGNETDGALTASVDAESCEIQHSVPDHDLPQEVANLRNVGYKLIPVPNDPEQRNILIIGVVANDFLTQVSALNKSFAKSAQAQDRYNVSVTDPQREINTILKGLKGVKVLMTVLLAQMPRGDAEALASRFAKIYHCSLESRATLIRENACLPNTIDVVISEADEAQATVGETVDLPEKQKHLIVLTPHPAYDYFSKDLVPSPLSLVLFRSLQGQNAAGIPPLHYQSITKWHFGAVDDTTQPHAAADRLYDSTVRSRKDQNNQYGILSTDLTPPIALTNREVATRILRSLRLQTGADIVLIQRRDLFFDKPAPGYENAPNCDAITVQPRDEAKKDESKGESKKDGPRNDCYLRDLFQRMLWKGDVLATTNLTGQQILNLIQTSHQLSDNDKALTAKDVSREWLVTFGIWQRLEDMPGQHNPASCPARPAPKGFDDLEAFGLPVSCHCHVSESPTSSPSDPSYCIDGKEIDPTRVYSVTTTDSLATGSDVYTDFNKPAVGKVDDILKKHNGNAGLVENVLDCWHNVSQVNKPDDKFDPSPLCAAEWPSLAEDNLPAREVEDVAAFTAQPGTINPKNDDIYEFEHQERGLLHYQLQQLQATFNDYHPTESDYQLGQVFGGVSDSRALQPHSSTIDLENNFRMFWESRHYDIGLATLLTYTKNIKGSSSGSANNVSYSNNQFSVGPVLQLHLGSEAHWGRFLRKKWNSKSPPDYKLVLSLFQVTGQVQRSRFAFAEDSQFTKQDPPLSLSLQRLFEPNLQWGAGPRVGFRHEFYGGKQWFWPDKTSFLEGGYQFSFQHSVLTAMDLLNPNNSPAYQVVTCSLEGGAGLAACVKAAQTADKTPGDVIVGPSTQFKGLYAPGSVFTRGWYWTSSLNFPLSSSKARPISALLQSSGDYFNDLGVSNQYATQTRFDVTSSLGLQFPVFGNLSFVPQYTIFLYENQNNRDWLAARTLAIALRWTFDRNSAIGPRTALSYKSPAAGGAAPTTGSGGGSH